MEGLAMLGRVAATRGHIPEAAVGVDEQDQPLDPPQPIDLPTWFER